jgi:hypothetical protein
MAPLLAPVTGRVTPLGETPGENRKQALTLHEMTASTLGGLFDWLFGNGWWSAGILLTAGIGFGLAFFVASRVVKPPDEGPALFVLFLLVGPLVAVAYAVALIRVASPDPGCTQECWGDLGLSALAGLGLVAWELGLLAGALTRRVRR